MEMAIPTGYQLTKPFPVLLVLLPFPAANWDLVVLENPNVVKKVRNNNTEFSTSVCHIIRHVFGPIM